MGLREGLSGDLRDLLNCMFVLTASLQCTCTLRETVCHPWIASGHRLSPEEVWREMESRRGLDWGEWLQGTVSSPLHTLPLPCTDLVTS